MGSSVVVQSLFSRSSLGKMGGGIREGKETAILTKSTFPDSEFFGSSLVCLWFVLGLLPEGDREGTKERNLKKNTLCFAYLIKKHYLCSLKGV